MFSLALVLFLALVGAACLLAYEARTGRLAGPSPGWTRARAAVFLGAAIAGGSLVASLPRREWALALALLPITLVCLARFAMLAQGRLGGWRLPVVTVLLFALGMAACLPFLPAPLSRTALMDRLVPGRETHLPDTIAPDAAFPVRV